MGEFGLKMGVEMALLMAVALRLENAGGLVSVDR